MNKLIAQIMRKTYLQFAGIPFCWEKICFIKIRKEIFTRADQRKIILDKGSVIIILFICVHFHNLEQIIKYTILYFRHVRYYVEIEIGSDKT